MALPAVYAATMHRVAHRPVTRRPVTTLADVRLDVVQSLLNTSVANGSWKVDRSPNATFGTTWLPVEADTHGRWQSHRSAHAFANSSILVLGSSPTRQLAMHLPLLLEGKFDSFQFRLDPASLYDCNSHSRWRSVIGTAWSCHALGCDASIGLGCHDCYCCCGCRSRRNCDGFDLAIVPRQTQFNGANMSLAFSWKPELLNSESDRRAFETRWCTTPPSLLIIGKGIHEAYFDAHTVASADLRALAWEQGRFFGINLSRPRIDVAEHTQRMEVALRAYVPMLRCLPEETLTVWLLPYKSHKVPWEDALISATASMMRRLHAEGALERGLLLDTRRMSERPAAPAATDGHHRQSAFQTVVWTIIARAFARWRGGREEV